MPGFLREGQIMSAAKNKLRQTIIFLLVLSLFPAVTTKPVGFPNTGVSPKNILFIPAFACGSISAFTLDRRTNFNPFDGLQTEAWILRQIQFDFARESSSFITGYDTRFAPHADFADIPIRASPCRHNRKFVINS